MKIKYWIPLFFLSAFCFACDNRPSRVLSGKKMESLLFDMYIAQAEIDNNHNVFSDSARKHDLLNAVFRKHGITQADFDSSLVWYSDNLEQYVKVNEKIIRRCAEMAEDLKTRQIENPEMLIAEETGVVYPVKNRTFFLRKTDLPQRVYTFQADTVLHEYNGAYDLRFCVLGLPPEIRPAVTFCVQCGDTAIVKRDSVRGNGFFTVSVSVLSAKPVSRLYGSIYFPEIDSDITLFFNHFTLSRKL
ncbi:MAG: DUF4296 domain-containing protein [Dysgonamonadaceae bacterium]|nr:DUF4296 domain-containing protein [Dysgonamonadaceae bacterium]